jgi:hypothetical protein
MDFQMHCILDHVGFPKHKYLAVSSVYHTCEVLQNIVCVYDGNCTAVHICLYNDLALILDADELQLLLTVYDWFMDNISNPNFNWTIHPASNIPPTITGTINNNTSAPTTVNAKYDIPTEYHTTTLVLPTLRLSLQPLPTTFHTITKVKYIVANHQIVPLQQIILVPKTLPIFLATTYTFFYPGGILSCDLQVDAIMCLQTQSPFFSLPPALRSEAWGVSMFSVFPWIPIPI